ncbi:MAG TPA: cation:proton antiporter [Dehalococcoidia bacterium]|jgi:CPA2 family monovalent cation:H+ antiporter-2|nr:cation:proton antiporter [Dehalococcoidia bacterium]
MIHSDLILTLVSVFVAAFFGGFFVTRLGLPPILGYLLAGVAIGPHTPGGSADTELALQLAEIGVILLMFGVGLHFSLREIASVGPIAVPGALGQSLVATLLGIGLTQIWGWSLTEGLIFGLCLSVASTVVLLRALEDRNLIETHAGRVAVGWLVMEDLFTVLILVLLPALADPSSGGEGLAGLVDTGSPAVTIVLSIGQAALFVVLMLFVGTRAIPWLLREVVRAGSRELFTLSILAVALGVAFGAAEFFGASLALGAFLAGMVLNESELSQRAGFEALPLRDAFAVVFFVSVGMLFEPSILIEEPVHVLFVIAIIVVGKSTAAFLIVTGIGWGVRTAVMASAALSQIGEFSFILVGLAISLDLMPDEATNLVLAGALISITVNPFMFRQTETFQRFLERYPRFMAFAQRRYPEVEEELDLRRHAVICGFGLAGQGLVRSLIGRNLPFVVIENDPFVFDRMRSSGIPSVFGDATIPEVLSQADVADARVFAVTFSNPSDTILAAQAARNLNPAIDIVARTSGSGSSALLRTTGVSEVVDPEFEASLEFVRHVLHRFGIDGREIVALQTRWRADYYRPE